MSSFEILPYLCTEEQFKKHLSGDYYKWLLKHFYNSTYKNGKEIDISVLFVKDGKIYLNPVEMIQSLIR